MKANPTLTVDHYNPAQNYIMVIPEKIPEKSDGGIILPESARGFLNEGLILKCGPDVDPIYQPGMHITFTQSSDYKVEMEDGQIFTIVMDTNVLLYRGNSVASLQKHRQGCDTQAQDAAENSQKRPIGISQKMQVDVEPIRKLEDLPIVFGAEQEARCPYVFNHGPQCRNMAGHVGAHRS